MRASSNNKSASVFRVFRRAVKAYGRPNRVRGDRGTENLLVAVDMIAARGSNRASYMWGTSTHNTRIERLWVEVGKQFMRAWRAFFTRLQRLYHLDSGNKEHLWLLMSMFLPMVNDDCKKFKKKWNRHSLDNSDVHHMTPNVSSFSFTRAKTNFSIQDLFLTGQIDHGVYPEAALDAESASGSDDDENSSEFSDSSGALEFDEEFYEENGEEGQGDLAGGENEAGEQVGAALVGGGAAAPVGGEALAAGVNITVGLLRYDKCKYMRTNAY